MPSSVALSINGPEVGPTLGSTHVDYSSAFAEFSWPHRPDLLGHSD